MRIGPAHVWIGRAAVAAVGGQTGHHPFAALMFQMIAQAHGWLIVFTLEPDRYGGIGLLAVELHRRNFDIHRRHVEFLLSQAIDHALTDRVSVVPAVLAAGETQYQKEGANRTHYSIIPGVAMLYCPQSLRTAQSTE